MDVRSEDSLNVPSDHPGDRNQESSPSRDSPPTSRAPTRVVHCADALEWLEQNAPLAGCSIVTSLPDISGFEHLAWSLEQWKVWFLKAAKLVLSATDKNGVTIFCQSDIKLHGVWIDKGYLCNRAADELGVPLRWHKIVCRYTPGKVTHKRPAYTHVLCYSHAAPNPNIQNCFPDVLPSTGRMVWSRATGVAVCDLACRYVLTHTDTRTVVDPFCGKGTILAVANSHGLDSVGVEIGAGRAKKARALTIALGKPEAEETVEPSRHSEGDAATESVSEALP